MNRLGECSLLWVLSWRKCGSRSFHFSGYYLLSKPYRHIVLPVEVYGGHVYLWHNVALSVCALLTKVFSGSCWDSEEGSMVVLIQSPTVSATLMAACLSGGREKWQVNTTGHCTDFFFFFSLHLFVPHVGLDAEFVAPAKILWSYWISKNDSSFCTKSWCPRK